MQVQVTPPKIDTRTQKRRPPSQHLYYAASWFVFSVIALLSAFLMGRTGLVVCGLFLVLAYLSLICAKLDDLKP